MTDREMMLYAIHSNEIEGHIFTDEEREYLMQIADGKISVNTALKKILRKEKK